MPLRHKVTSRSTLCLMAFLSYCAVAIVHTFPLVSHLGDALPNDAADPAFNTWLLWWNAHTVPLTTEWWNAPFFHPVPDAMAFSESLLGLALITSPLQWLGASPTQAYNLAFLFSFPLSAFAAFLLCLVLTERLDAAFVGGLAYGFAPYRAAQFAHLQVLSSYWAPLSLLGLHLYLRTRRTRWLVLFASAFVAQALCSVYFLIFLSVLGMFWVLWFVRSSRDLARIAVAWTLAVASLLPLLLKYRDVQSGFAFDRSVSAIESYAADVFGLLEGSPLLSHWRSPRFSGEEGCLFPGLTVPTLVGFAVVGFALRTPADPRARSRTRLAVAMLAALFAVVALSRSILGPWAIGLGPLTISVKALHKPLGLACDLLILGLATSCRVREARGRGDNFGFYAIAALAMWLLSLGPSPTFLGMRIWDRGPYSWLMILPGVSGFRVPARFAMLMALCLCVAAALALAAALRRVRFGGNVLVVVVAVGVLWDAWITSLPLVPVPAASPLATRPGNDGSVLELPLGGLTDAAALYRSIDHRRPVLNGYSSYYPPHYLPLLVGLERHDDFLSALPVRGPLYVVVDLTRDARGFLSRYVSRQRGARQHRVQPEGLRLCRSPPSPAARLPARLLEIHSIRTNDQEPLVDFMRDNDAQTRWTTSRRQRGTERIVVDLGSVQTVGSVVLSLGPHRAEFPRDLIVEVSYAGSGWQEVFRGPTAAQVVAASLEDHRLTPLRVDVGGRPARYLRLRLGSKDRRHHWSVTELEVWSPAEPLPASWAAPSAVLDPQARSVADDPAQPQPPAR